MKTLNLEQVKEHFKYAKEVRCVGKSIYEGHLYEINLEHAHNGTGIFKDSVYCVTKQGSASGDCLLYNSDTNQLAEILTYIFDRGEEVEVLATAGIRKQGKFLTFTSKGLPVVELECGNVDVFLDIRKLTPESLLEPQLTELKKTAEANGMSVEIIFKQK